MRFGDKSRKRASDLPTRESKSLKNQIRDWAFNNSNWFAVCLFRLEKQRDLLETKRIRK